VLVSDRPACFDGFACQSQRKSAVERGGLFALLFFIILTIHGESTVFQILK
jgi:hypothetical protein